MPEREPESNSDPDKEEEDRRNEEDDEEEELDRQERQDDEDDEGDDDLYSDDMTVRSLNPPTRIGFLDGASMIRATRGWLGDVPAE